MELKKMMLALSLVFAGVFASGTQATAQTRTTVYSPDQNFTGYPYYRVVTGNILSTVPGSKADQIALKATVPLYGINGYVRIFLKSGDLALLRSSLGRNLNVNENVSVGLMCSYNRDISIGYQAGGWLIIGSTCRYRFVQVSAPADPLALAKTQVSQLYLDVLGRTADAAGLEYYSGLVANKQATIDQVRESMAFSDESRNNVDALYVSLLKRNATYEELKTQQAFLAYQKGTLAKIKTSITTSSEYQNLIAAQQPVYDYSWLNSYNWWY